MNLVVRHILQDWNEVRQQEDVEHSEEPQEDSHKDVNRPSDTCSGGLQPLSDRAEMVQTSYDYNRPLQGSVDLSKDLNQQTDVVSGQLDAQEDTSISMDVKGGDRDGQSCVYDSEGNAENSQKAFADVVTLEKHEGPVEQTFSSQTEQDGREGDVHGVQFEQSCLSRYGGPLWSFSYCQRKTTFLNCSLKRNK